jgi:WD40 repeat protein
MSLNGCKPAGDYIGSTPSAVEPRDISVENDNTPMPKASVEDVQESLEELNLSRTPDRYPAPQITYKPMDTPPPGTYILYARNNVEGPDLNSIRSISPETGEFWTIYESSNYEVFMSELSSDGRKIAFLDMERKNLQLLDLLSNTLETIQLPFLTIRVSWTPNGNGLIVETMNQIALFEPRTGKWTTVYFKDPRFSCGTFRWSPDGRWMAFICASESSGPQDPRNGVYVMEATCLQEETECELILDLQLPETAAYAWSPDGNMLALCSLQDGLELKLFIYSPDTENLASDQKCGSIEKIKWSRDGDKIAGSVGSDIDVYDLSARNLRTVLRDENMVQLISWIEFPLENPDDG